MTPSPEALVHSELRENVHTRHLPPRVINKIAAVGRIAKYEDGEYLFHQGDFAGHIYIIIKGTVWLQSRETGDGVRVWTIGAPDLVGWSCLTPPFHYLLDARASGRVEALELDANALREQIQVDHELGYHLFQILLSTAAQRLAPYLHAPGESAPWPHPLLW